MRACERYRSFQKSLLSKLTSSALGSTEQKSEKDKAFDLLDALSRSGKNNDFLIHFDDILTSK